MIEELNEVLVRDKFSRYVTREQRKRFLESLICESELVEIIEKVEVSPVARGNLIDAALALEWLGNTAEEEGAPVFFETAPVEAVAESAARADDLIPAFTETSELGAIVSRTLEVEDIDKPWLTDELLEKIFG